MSETPPIVGGFVEVPPPNVPFGGSSDYMRMLREAQGESSCRTSCRTSCRVSPYMSHNSPKSPPNSPFNEREDVTDNVENHDTDLSEVYINTISDGDTSDFIWDWSSRPNIAPPKQWKLQAINSTKSSCSSKTSIESKKQKAGYSTKVVISFLLTNVISLLIGAGIGMWIKRKIVKTVL